MKALMAVLEWIKSFTAGQVSLFSGVVGCSYYFTDGMGASLIPFPDYLFIGAIDSVMAVVGGSYFLYLRASIKGKKKMIEFNKEYFTRASSYVAQTVSFSQRQK